MKKGICHITKNEFEINKLVDGFSIKPQIITLIKKDYPDFSLDKYISLESLNTYRKKYLEQLVTKEKKELNHLEKQVVKAIQNNTLLSKNIEPELNLELSFGQKTADNITIFFAPFAHRLMLLLKVEEIEE